MNEGNPKVMTPNPQENEWVEELPPNCPPESAFAPKYDRYFYQP